MLTTQKKSVGGAMAIGRTFKESLQKAALAENWQPCAQHPQATLS
jgi:carbamoylphosphate synthase large subunit